MDDEMKAYLDNMMARINDQFERILDNLSAIRADTDNTKGHLLFGLQESLTLSQRITKLEDEIRRRGE